MRTAILISLLLHGGLWLGLRLRPSVTPVEPAPPSVIVEYGAPPPALDRNQFAQKYVPRARPVRRKRARPSDTRNAARLVPDLLGRIDARPAVVGRGYEPLAEDTSGWSREDWGAGGGSVFGYASHALSLGRLIEEIDAVLHYPYALGERQIGGVVNARLTFGDGSRCRWPPRITGAHPYLRVYLLAVLKKVCALDTTASFGFEPGQIVDLSAGFVLTDRPDPRHAPGRIAGNVLMFERTYPINRFGYKIGPIRGAWFVPAVALDWDWVLEHWESWVGGRDPLGDFRE